MGQGGSMERGRAGGFGGGGGGERARGGSHLQDMSKQEASYKFGHRWMHVSLHKGLATKTATKRGGKR